LEKSIEDFEEEPSTIDEFDLNEFGEVGNVYVKAKDKGSIKRNAENHNKRCKIE